MVDISLPYGKTVAHTILQWHNGSFSHQGALRWGVDFAFWLEEDVLSVCSGVVIEANQDVPDGSPKSYIKKRSESYDHALKIDQSLGLSGIGNFVTIMSDKGYYVTYCHFGNKSLMVNVGDRVITGKILGKIGCTGLRTNPHLHIHFGTSKIKWRAGIIADGSLDKSCPIVFSAIGETGKVGEKYTGDNVGPSPVRSFWNKTYIA